MTNIKTLSLAFFLTIVTSAFGQHYKVDQDGKPFIEVTGTAYKEVVPDEIYISIVIREKYVGKEKVTIESQEEKLKASLKEVGIDIKQLSLSDANADYVTVKWMKKDVITKKNYTLKVSDATTVGLAFQQLEKLEITDAFISRVNYSKLDSLKKEVKIQAIKAAKNEADYLLSAIGEQTGKPLVVQESEKPVTARTAGVAIGRGRNRMKMKAYSDEASNEGEKEDEIQFEKIKVEAAIYVKFSIKDM